MAFRGTDPRAQSAGPGSVRPSKEGLVYVRRRSIANPPMASSAIVIGSGTLPPVAP